MAHNFTHTSKVIRVQRRIASIQLHWLTGRKTPIYLLTLGEKVGLEGRFYARYIFVIRCGMICSVYDMECLWPGWTTECEVVENGVVKEEHMA